LNGISAPGGNSAVFIYQFNAPALPGGGAGLAIDLLHVRYNKSPTNAGCFKNDVLFSYDLSATDPLSISMLGNTALVRVRKISKVMVFSRPSCTEPDVVLRTYTFNYQPDPDTELPRLQSVTMQGQRGTPEGNVLLPVATYTYGTATNVAGGLTYRRTQRLSLPSGVDARGIASSFSDVLGKPPAAPEYSQGQGSVTWQNLIDINGDGRPDLTYLKDGQLFAWHNIPGFRVPENGGPVAFGGSLRLTGGLGNVLSTGALEMRSAQTSRTPKRGGYIFNTDMVWRQAIDVNGDGRLDLIDAKEEAGSWVVYLNTPSTTPSPTNPSLVVWVRRTISIAPLVTHLREAGHSVSANYLPLSQRKTGASVQHRTCWRWQSGPTGQFHWVENAEGFFTGACTGPPDSVFSVSPEHTFVEWEVRDINGDGYPDVVFDSVPVVAKIDNREPLFEPAPPTPGEFRGSFRTESIQFDSGNDISAMFNVAGMQVHRNTNAFSSPFVIKSFTSCAVENWVNGSQKCHFADIDGDGLPDHIEGGTVSFNTGSLSEAFFTGSMRFSGTSTSHSVPQYQICDGDFPPPPSREYQSTQQSGLRDLNGDGIPDSILFTPQTGAWSARFGTGAGFSNAKPIDVPNAQFALSQETENCGGTRSDTTSGLYDMDGDGRPEVIVLNDGSLDVYQLNAERDPNHPFEGNVPSSPTEGRLVKIANGYGAVTTIGYRSAKEDYITWHQVPFSEIVVTAVGTTDEFGSSLEAPTLYAYGHAELHFDPAYDAFIFPGYRLSVALRITSNQVIPPPTDGVATITETYPLAPFDESMDANARFKRYLKAGHVSDVTTISGNVGRDPWALLETNVNTDPRRIASTHYDWDTRILPTGPTGNEYCIDMVYPYDYFGSALFQLGHLNDSHDQSTVHGFVFPKSTLSWRGTPGTASPLATDRTVLTKTDVQSVDDFGQITSVAQFNDLFRGDDNLCTQTVYATPIGSNERVLSAPASRTITNCASPAVTLAKDTWEYDTSASGVKLPPGSVSNGFVTGHVVSRLKLDNGAPIIGVDGASDIRTFDATYDTTTGKLITITKTREDGAAQKTTVAYDPFALAPVTVKIDATNADGTRLPSLRTILTRNPLTLDVLSTTDPNGTQSGNTYDGFGRVLLSTVTPAGGTTGALSSMSYVGFGVGESGGRRVVQKVFTDPVALANVGAAAGRTSTTFLDALGRITRTEVALGTDYANQTLILGQRVYDKLGRVQFEADPHPSTESMGTAYGASWFFNTDGTPSCVVRSNGPQAFTAVTNEAHERYPTCFSRVFANNREFVDTRDAASLLAGSPQAGVVHRSTYSAIGQLLERATYKSDFIKIEGVQFDYDRLGHLIRMARYQDPQSETTAAVTTWHFDSLGQMLELDEPDSAPQFRSYDNWGELTLTQWNDTTTTPSSDRRSIKRYDALSRLVHREDQTNQVVDAATVNDFVYDQAVNTTTPPVTATNVLGRLAKATSPTSSVSFSYDAFGQVNAQVFTDRTTTSANVYVQKHTFHGDGSVKTLDFLLPDTTPAKDERIDYSYDSAGRTRSVKYSDGTINMDLFTATGGADIDVFGRVRQAKYGLAIYTADYADTGRRLLNSVLVASPAPLTTSRQIAFPEISGTDAATTAFDPLGRERVRRETKDGGAGAPWLSEYDAVGQLIASKQLDESSLATTTLRSFTYDKLGNVLTQSDPASGNPGSVTLSYQTTDPDRICSIAYGTAAPATVCNVKYDGVGNIIEKPSRSNGRRTLTYSPSGQVKTIVDGGTNATFDYDAFGAVQRLVLNSTSSTDTRHDKHFGALIYQRDERDNNTKKSVITRSIPGPDGLIATRHGPGANDPWTFVFGEPRGNRFFTDQTGAFVQDVSYEPYGEVASSSGAQPGSQKYTNAQWNGGDALAALGLSQLGARIYDPVIGRFLSRDPLLIPRTAATTNPYTFAMNDPVNSADPTGLDNGAECLICQPTPFDPIPGFLPGFPGGPPLPPSGGGSKPSGPVHGPVVSVPGAGLASPKPQEPNTSTTGGSGGDRRPPIDQIGPPWATSPTLAGNPLFTQLDDSDIYRLSPMGRELFGSFLEWQYGARPYFDRTFFRVGSITEASAYAATDSSGGWGSLITLDKTRFWRLGTSLSKMSKIAHELVHVLQTEQLGFYNMQVRTEGERRSWSRDTIDTIPDWADFMKNHRSQFGMFVVSPFFTLEQSAVIGEFRFYMEQQIRAGNINFRW